MALHIDRTARPDPTRATICLYGNAGLGKTQTCLAIADGGAPVLVLSVEDAGGLRGRVAAINEPADVEEAISHLQAKPYKGVVVDGLERVFQLGFDAMQAGHEVKFGGRTYRPPTTRDPRMVYGAAGQWLDAITTAFHRLPMLTVFTTHAKQFESEWVTGKNRQQVATMIDISVDLAPGARTFMEEKVDFLLYVTLPPNQDQSVILASHAWKQAAAKISMQNDEPIMVTRKLNAKHRFGTFPRTLPLSWQNLAGAIGLDPLSLGDVAARPTEEETA